MVEGFPSPSFDAFPTKMAPTFAPAAVVPQLVAASALTQLNRYCVFPQAAQGNYEPVAFQKGDSVTVRRARIARSQDYDPRSGVPAVSIEPGYQSNNLILERLWTAGFPVYGHDNRDSVSKYVSEYGEQIGHAIAEDNDNYFYNKFRTVTVPPTGTVAYSSQPPVSLVAAQKDGQLQDFNKQLLINANVVLNRNNVPPGNRYSIISSAASGGFLGDSVLVEGFGATAVGAGKMLTTGMGPGIFVPRYGFECSSSNAVGFQIEQPNLGSGAPTVAISSVAPNTSFTMPDYATTTLLGALDFTFATAPANVAVGQIAKIAPETGNAVAFGLILRVQGVVVTLVPVSPTGRQLTAAEINTTSHKFSIPSIPSISVAYHREALIFATRNLSQPSDNSGATMTTMSSEQTGLVVQIFKGEYRVDEFRESQRYAMLIGALLTDQRKACLMLSL